MQKVKDIIEMLKSFDPEAPICYWYPADDCQDESFEPIMITSIEKLQPNSKLDPNSLVIVPYA